MFKRNCVVKYVDNFGVEQQMEYTGISAHEGKIEGGEFKIRDPENGEWKKLE